jgi:hypothetical protein
MHEAAELYHRTDQDPIEALKNVLRLAS